MALGMALLTFLVVFAGAQTARPKIAPPEFKREFEEDAAGLRQWKAFDVTCDHCKGVKVQVCDHCKDSKLPVCQECKGEKRASCRPCGGKGKLPDPMVELACPYCWGSSWYVCGLCNSWGFMNISEVETKCGACKQKGMIPCGACNGERRVASAKFGKKGVGEASAKELKELLEKLRESLAALEKFEPESNPSKSMKAFSKTVVSLERELKVVKDMQKLLDDVLKGIKSHGAAYTMFEEQLTTQFLIFKDRTVYLLQHQIRAAEQSLERAEFNESKAK
jgi:hypothetical protein